MRRTEPGFDWRMVTPGTSNAAAGPAARIRPAATAMVNCMGFIVSPEDAYGRSRTALRRSAEPWEVEPGSGAVDDRARPLGGEGTTRRARRGDDGQENRRTVPHPNDGPEAGNAVSVVVHIATRQSIPCARKIEDGRFDRFRRGSRGRQVTCCQR